MGILWRLTNRRIRHLPQARLVQGTSRAIVGTDDLNVMQSKAYLCLAVCGIFTACATGKVSQFSTARAEAARLRVKYSSWRTVVHPGQGDQMRVKVSDLSEEARNVGFHGGFVDPQAVVLYTGFENGVGEGLAVLNDDRISIRDLKFVSFKFEPTGEPGILKFSQRIGMHNQLPDTTSRSVTPPAGARVAPSVAADH